MLTSIISFLIPLLMLGVLIFALLVTSHVPYLEPVGAFGLKQLFAFLTVFGAGSALQGSLTLSLVSSLVSSLFDTYTFYRYQILRGS